ncbi:EAL domain-containing protein [Erythrobacter arachoides]|uniref:EAL domain-containing protein n=1 Tax=Aurantiacibacter arachoides TaxID=1850444 RepID=A0A844ZZW4_9SPHN|nr:EAL domain-containing protein [Aurantiacibacter arachoides]MXO93004.1 EAL domain-containing protein [Aurantiacibacter arachoides]
MTFPAQIYERRTRHDRRRVDPHPITHDLAEALVADEIDLMFQPQFASDSQALVGAEALVRWRHPNHGVLAGDALVGIAQSGGMARRLARHIARSALREAASWPPVLRLSLNVTAMDLADRSFAEEMLALVAQSGFPADRLTLEITEQALVADLERSAKRLATLAEAGIRIALDDFGAGFCNFRYLKTLPIDALKLDRSMIEGVAQDKRDLAILRGILAMADALGLTVIAEGVETDDQRLIAAREGCAVWQGFLGAEPMAASDFTLFAAR